jgi:hypothetical protein
MRQQLITEDQAMDLYEDMLNECYRRVEFGNLSYAPSTVLREVDPTAFRCGFNDYVDSLTEDGIFVEGLTDSEMDSDEVGGDSDDGYALASAGFGTDEDYGYFGDEE